jgi:hypothetical protein
MPSSKGGFENMKFKSSILSSLILSILFASNAQAILDPSEVSVGQGESLADQLLQTSNEGGVFIPSDPRFPSTPQKSRELQQNKTELNWTMPSSLAGFGSSAKSSREEAKTMTDEATLNTETTPLQETAPVANTAATTESELPPSQPSVASVGGSWYFELNDSSKRDVALALFQSGNYVYGAGNMRERNSTLQVAASGSVQGETMDLDIISLGTINLYKLTLDLSGDSASGDYQVFSASGDAWKGSVEGMRIASQE